FPDGVSVSMQVANTSERVRVAEAVVAMLGESGINVDLRVRDPNQYVLFSRGEDDMLMGVGGSRADPLGTIDILVGPISASIPDGTVSDEFDQKLAQAKKLSADNPERTKLLQELNQEILDEVAWMPL